MKKDDHIDFDSLEEQKPSKKKKFNLFDMLYTRSEKRRKNIDYDPNHKRDFPYFFRMLMDHLTNLFYVNLLYVFGNFPIFLILLAVSTNLHTRVQAPADALFAPIYGAMQNGAVTPSTASMYGLYGASSTVSLWTPLAYTALILGIVLLLFTFGPVNTGVTYILRNIVKGEPIFLWTDFWYAIKRNVRQEFVLGVLDLGFLCLIVYDIYFFYLNINGTLTGIFFYFSIFIALLYLMMRFYLYLMMVTFDLSLRKLFKNALIFSMLGLGRNLVALLGIAFVAFFNLALMQVFLPLGIILPFMITVGLCSFIAAYAAWPKISKIMIEPYVDENDSSSDPDGSEFDRDGENEDESAAGENGQA